MMSKYPNSLLLKSIDQTKIDALIAVLKEDYPVCLERLLYVLIMNRTTRITTAVFDIHDQSSNQSVWADDIKKSEFPESGYWHFIKLPYVLVYYYSCIDIQQDNVTYDSPYNTVNIINKIEELKNTFDILTYSKDQVESSPLLL